MKIKCKICGCEFNPIVEEHYISRDEGNVGVFNVLVSKPEEKLYDTFDCPECGCQVIVQERKRQYIPYVTCADEDKEESENNMEE